MEHVLGIYWPTVLTTCVAFIAFASLFAWLCMRLGDVGRDRQLNLLIASLGGLFGWALGMFFAPYSTDEGRLFAEIGRTVSAFVSGYAVSKFDRFVESSMFRDKAPVPLAWSRAGLFVGAMLLVLLFVYSNRQYFRIEAKASTATATPSATAAPNATR
jgi:hypothetical protein